MSKCSRTSRFLSGSTGRIRMAARRASLNSPLPTCSDTEIDRLSGMAMTKLEKSLLLLILKENMLKDMFEVITSGLKKYSFT